MISGSVSSLGGIKKRAQQLDKFPNEFKTGLAVVAAKGLKSYKDNLKVEAPIDTGDLRKSFTVSISGGGWSYTLTPKSSVGYALPVARGHKSYKVSPKNKTKMKFVVNGVTVFTPKTITVKATKANPYDKRAAKNAVGVMKLQTRSLFKKVFA